MSPVSLVDSDDLLEAWSSGDASARDELIRRVYPELRFVASRLLRKNGDITLQVTELVNELYLQLVRLNYMTWADGRHFLATAARLMRHILVDELRRRKSLKRGAGAPRVGVATVSLSTPPESTVDVLALSQALNRLQKREPVAVRLVELRFFAGLSIDEAARALGIGRTSAVDHWQYARAWLRSELDRRQPSEGG